MKSGLLLFVLCAAAPAQTIEGWVVDSVTNMPVAGAYAAIGGPTINDRYLPITDRAGHFVWNVPPGVTYQVAVSGAGYLPTAQPVIVTPGQDSGNLRIALTPQAVISGKLEDEDGFPVEGAYVEAWQYATDGSGQRVLREVRAASSNDLGEYRIAGLAAGSYYLRAVPGYRIRDRRYLPQYPGSLDAAGSTPIEVAAGQERSVVFPLVRYEGVTVSVSLSLPPGDAAKIPSIRIEPADGWGYSNFAVWSAELRSFTFHHVPPGSYTLQAGPQVAAPGSLIGRQEIQVAGSDVTNVVLPLHAANTQGE